MEEWVLGCADLTFLLLLHSHHAVLFARLLLLMDINITTRGTEFAVEGVSFVCVEPSFPPCSGAGPCRHRTAGPMNPTSGAQLNATRDTTPRHRGGRHVIGYNAVKEWCDNDAYR